MAAGLALVPLIGLALTAQAVGKPIAADPDLGGKCDRHHGTAVEFVDSPKEAAHKAKKEEKLVFVLHVSGNFEDPRFT